MGIEVLAISCVTNKAAGLNTQPLSHEEVFETGRLVERRLSGVVERLVVWISTLMEAES
jgi:purine-nucleoside phosphorylase